MTMRARSTGAQVWATIGVVPGLAVGIGDGASEIRPRGATSVLGAAVVVTAAGELFTSNVTLESGDTSNGRLCGPPCEV